MRAFALSVGLALTAAVCWSQSLSFDGKQEAVIPDCPGLDIKGEITVECWIKPDDRDPDHSFRYLFSKNYGSVGWGVLMNIDYRLHGTGLDHTDAQIPLNEWTHIAYVSSRKKTKAYINGILAEERPTGTPLTNSEFQLCVGCSSFFGFPGNTLTNYSGLMDEVRIWDKAYTEAQIRARMNRRLTGRERHLLVYLPLDEGQGDKARNAAGNTPPLRLGRSFTPDEWDPKWSPESPFSRKPR